jgi:hypothetical protein
MKIVTNHLDIKLLDSFTIPLTPNLVSETDCSGPWNVWTRMGPWEWDVMDYRTGETWKFGGEECDPKVLFEDVKEFHILDSSDLQQFDN